MTDKSLVPSEALDFSSYQAGDVIVIENAALIKMGRDCWETFMATLQVECSRRKITYIIEHDALNDAIRISLEA